MNVWNVSSCVILVIAIIIVLYTIIDLYIKKKKYIKQEILTIPNNKYLVNIVIIMLLLIIYGLLRNFV